MSSRTVDKEKSDTRVDCLRSLSSEELVQVPQIRILPKVSSHSNLVSVLRGRNVPDCVVELLQAANRDRIVAFGIDMTIMRSGDLDGRCTSTTNTSSGGDQTRIALILDVGKVRSWLDQLNVVVQILREAIGGRAHGSATTSMRIDMVFLQDVRPENYIVKSQLRTVSSIFSARLMGTSTLIVSPDAERVRADLLIPWDASHSLTEVTLSV